MTERDQFKDLTGAFDRPVAPAPAFAARLRTQVLAELTDAQGVDAMAAGSGSVSHSAHGVATERDKAMAMHASSNGQVVDLRSAVPGVIPQRAHSRRPAHRLLRWLPAFEVAAAILLVLTLFGQLIGPEMLRNAVIPDAFQSAQLDTPDDAVMWGANPGRTWAHEGSAPVVSPDTGFTSLLGHANQNVFGSLIYEHHLYRVMRVGEQNMLQALDLTTGREMWRQDGNFTGWIAAADGLLIAALFTGDETADVINGQLTALDATTGDKRWLGPEIPRDLFGGDLNGPVIDGRTVYVASNSGDVTAYNLDTGALEWDAAVDPASLVYDSRVEERSFEGGAFAVANNQVYVVTAGADLRALDAESGEEQWTLSLRDRISGQVGYASVQATEDHVLVATAERLEDTSQGSIAVAEARWGLGQQVIASVDAADGSVEWLKEIGNYVGSPVIVDGFAYVPTSEPGIGSVTIAGIILESGDIERRSQPLGTGNEPFAEGSGAANGAYFATSYHELVHIERDGGMSFWEMPVPDDENSGSATGAAPLLPLTPPLLSQGNLYLVWTSGAVDVLTAEQTPFSSPQLSATPAATTPQASPAATAAEDALERSTGAGGSFTFDVAVPATSPGSPEVFPASDEGQLVLAADVAGETLVRLVVPSLEQFDSTSVEAVSLATGDQQWIVPVANAGAPIIADGRVFVSEVSYVRAGTERSILALDLATGDELWRVPFSGRPSEFPGYSLVVGSTIYVSDALGVVQALDVATGEVRWTAPGSLIETAFSASGDRLVEVQTAPVADDQHIYTQTADGVLRALDLTTGEPVWSVPILGTYGDRAYYVAAMADDGSVIFDIFEIPSFESMNATPADGITTPVSITVALDAATGRELWQRAGDTDSEESSGAELIGSDLVLGYGFDGVLDGLRPLVALNASDGTEIWQSDVIPNQSNWWTMAHDHAIAIVPGGALIAIDLATGKEAWRAAMPPMEPAIPAIVTEDKIVVVGVNGEVLVWRI